MKGLIFDAGSSSLKFRMLKAHGERTLTEGNIGAVTTHADAVAHVLREMKQLILTPKGALQ
jgi:acetate kinase